MEKHIPVETMSQLTSLNKEEELAIENSFPIKTFSKGAYLLKQGQIANEAYFVITGAIREYKLSDGLEKTIAFHTENQAAINFDSLTNRSPSRINFVCAETTTLAVLDAEKEKKLYKNHPRFEAFCRSGVEQMVGKKQEQITDLITLKPAQRYLKLQEERPDLIKRFPHHQIASYLGIKPETLSRIRARLAKKSK